MIIGVLRGSPRCQPQVLVLLLVMMSVLCRTQVLVQSAIQTQALLSLPGNKWSKRRPLARGMRVLCWQRFPFHLFLLCILCLSQQRGLIDSDFVVAAPTLCLYHPDSFPPLCVNVELSCFDFLRILDSSLPLCGWKRKLMEVQGLPWGITLVSSISSWCDKGP